MNAAGQEVVRINSRFSLKIKRFEEKGKIAIGELSGFSSFDALFSQNEELGSFGHSIHRDFMV